MNGSLNLSQQQKKRVMSDKPAKDRDSPSLAAFHKEMDTISLRQQRPQEDLNYKSSGDECGDDGIDGVLEEGKSKRSWSGLCRKGVEDGMGKAGMEVVPLMRFDFSAHSIFFTNKLKP